MGIDETINQFFTPFAKIFSDIIFFSVSVAGTDLQLIVLWLVVGAAFFTLYLRFINVRGFMHALRLVRGDYTDRNAPGEVSHFQALATAISGTVGVGNIAHVAVAISVGGPGAAFWMWVAGALGMASKFAECTLGVKYRQDNADGSVSGGPMFYMHKGLAERNWPRLGRAMAIYYAICILIGALGIGSMFQSNQAFVQFVTVTGGDESFFAARGWLVGLALAMVVGVVIVGGIRSIASVASTIVPFMALLYISSGLFVIAANAGEVPRALSQIIIGAFTPQGATGGMLGVLILGFRRAAFSNEAGIGSSSVAHSAVRTNEPVTEGFVSLLEPFIDTIIVCSITALVITLTVYDPQHPLRRHQRCAAHLHSLCQRDPLVPDPAGSHRDALRLLHDDRLVLLWTRGVDLPLRTRDLGQAHVQHDLLRFRRARMHDSTRRDSRFFRRNDLRDGARKYARALYAGARRSQRARFVLGAARIR